jgi:creatinine amidohydrolase/Fe(II)-dependent formamide hydrolase-like protein
MTLRSLLLCVALLAAAATGVAAQETVELELMTYPEVATALQHGKTTVLIDNGGTEQRGPHAVLGGHTFIAHRATIEIARQLGNALVAPVLPYSVAGSHLNPKWPGSVNLPGPLFAAVNEAVVDSMVVNGFRHIVLMGDHGGGQAELAALARRLDRKYAPRGVHVHYCGDAYTKTRADEDAWVRSKGLPASTHGGVPDTSILMFLGGDRYVRRDQLTAGDPVVPAERAAGRAAPRLDNGITGDPRPSTPDMGQLFFEMQVRNAVAQIRALTGVSPAPAPAAR